MAEAPDPQQKCGARWGTLEHQQDKKKRCHSGELGALFGKELQAVEHGKRPERAHQQEVVNLRLQSLPRGGNAGHRATAWSPRGRKEKLKSDESFAHLSNKRDMCKNVSHGVERTPGIADPGMMGPKRRGVQRDRDLIATFCSEVCKSRALRKAVARSPQHAGERRTEVAGCTTTWERVVAPPAETREPDVGRQGRTPTNSSIRPRFTD